MKRTAAIFMAFLLAAFMADETVAGENTTTTASGVTADLLPAALSISAGETGGALQVWAARDHWKARLVGAALTLPDAMDGSETFDNHRLRVAALIVDYTFGQQHDGLWIGAGAERWFSSIEHIGDSDRHRWAETVATLGGGYIWFHGPLEINPWWAAHYSLDPVDLRVAGDRFHPSPFSMEASLKLGWRFR